MGFIERYQARRLKKLKVKRMREVGKARLRASVAEEKGAIRKAKSTGFGARSSENIISGLSKARKGIGNFTSNLNPNVNLVGPSYSSRPTKGKKKDQRGPFDFRY